MTVKKCDSGIEKLHKDVKVLGDKLDIANMKIHELDVAFKNQDEKITDHLAAFSIMQVQFDNLCEEQARQKFEIDNLRTNNNRLKDIQSKVDSYSLRVEELMLKIEALHSIVEGMKQTRKEELQYRQKRAKERKEESEKRDQQRKEDREKKEKDRKSNLRWVIGIVVSLLISMGGFIWDGKRHL